MSTRPKRSTRQVNRVDPFDEASSITASQKERRKRKDPPKTVDPGDQLDYLLTNSKSALTSCDIFDLINASTWDLLSSESKSLLVHSLPRTAFLDFQPTLDPSHPSQASSSSTALKPSSSSSSAGKPEGQSEPSSAPGPTVEWTPNVDLLDPNFFTDPHLLSATKTWQDHIFSSWMTKTHLGKVEKYLQGLREENSSGAGSSTGSGDRDGRVGLHAPWKDEEWEMDLEDERKKREKGRKKNANVNHLISHLNEGDVIVYKRVFVDSNTNEPLTVEKDAMVQSLSPTSISFRIRSGQKKHLPVGVVSPFLGAEASALDDSDADPECELQTLHGPTAVGMEGWMLDLDGRIARSDARRSGILSSNNPNNPSFDSQNNSGSDIDVQMQTEAESSKRFSIWRFRDDSDPFADSNGNGNGRGGRENHGTLFYLRAVANG